MGDFSFFADPGSVVLSPPYGGLGVKTMRNNLYGVEVKIL